MRDSKRSTRRILFILMYHMHYRNVSSSRYSFQKQKRSHLLTKNFETVSHCFINLKILFSFLDCFNSICILILSMQKQNLTGEDLKL